MTRGYFMVACYIAELVQINCNLPLYLFSRDTSQRADYWEPLGIVLLLLSDNGGTLLLCKHRGIACIQATFDHYSFNLQCGSGDLHNC